VKDLSADRGASALVLSGELTEGVSDLSQAMTAPGGVPALREVNQDRSHPDAPEIEEQPAASYRRIVASGGGPPGGQAWTNISNRGREGHMPHAGPATVIATAAREAATASAERDARPHAAPYLPPQGTNTNV
jgi:hypothetical protein